MDKIASSNLIIFSLSHATVDASCAALIFSMPYPIISYEFITLAILYNILAFGLQPLIGILSDKWKIPKIFAILGIIMTASSLILGLVPIIAVIIAGIGNALFHVGAGTIILNINPRRAAAPGIFVAPGALGLLIGTLISKGGYFIAWPFILTLLILALIIYYLDTPNIDYRTKKPSKNIEVLLVLILFAVTVRSFVGSVLVFPWKSDISLLYTLTLSIVLGKAIGGLIADRFGWRKVVVASLIISAPILAFAAAIPVIAILGMFLFNIAMPVTLVAISNALPGKPGFAFGLTCLALVAGALLAFAGLSLVWWSALIIILLCTLALYISLNKKSITL